MKCLANRSVASKLINREITARNNVLTTTMLACSVHILLDKHEFTPEKAAEFLAHTEYLYTSVCEGYVSFEDILKTLEDEHGIILRFKRAGKDDNNGLDD